LGVKDAVYYSGPPRDQYLLIARRTIEVLNAGGSLANLGIAEERASQLATMEDTIGGFLTKLSKEARKNYDCRTFQLPNG
jgi:hypothetical protein